jgi:hypothetical protein
MHAAPATRAKSNRSDEEIVMREIVAAKLRAFWPEARIIHELPLRYSERRIDMAAVTPDEIVSVEIKSSRDVVDRLEAQLRGFAPISTALICALAPKWNEALPMIRVASKKAGVTAFREPRTEAREIISRIDARIETWTVDAAAGSVEGATYRPFRVATPWPARMLGILHVVELVEIAGRHGVWSGRKAIPHHDIVTRCAELMTGREVTRAVCRALRRRDAFDKASDAPVLEEAMESP